MRLSVLKTTIMAAALAGLSVSAASAADMARPYVKAPPMVAPVWTWTGFYVGANGGYSWGRSRTDVSYFNTLTGVPIVPPAGSVLSGAFDMDGGVAGGQAGYNWQTANWVWGFEADIQWSGEKGRNTYSCAATPIVGGACLPGLTFLPAGATGTTFAVDEKLEWFGTARLRGGILATPQVLLYATGGLAYGSIKTTGSLSGFTPAGVLVASSASNSDVRVGWTVGAGVEGKITESWSAKLEYLYMDLGRFDSGPYSLAPLSLISANVSSRFTDHILRAGINYQFGGPVVPKY
jgi:outer membrane immunogenic protein